MPLDDLAVRGAGGEIKDDADDDDDEDDDDRAQW